MKNTWPSVSRFIGFLKLRQLARRTQKEYVRYLKKLGEYFHCDPSQLRQSQFRRYLLHLVDERKFSGSAMSICKAAFKLFYRDMLRRMNWTVFQEVIVRRPRAMPLVLPREDVARLLQAVRLERIRVCLKLIYHCGLRIGEAVRMRPYDLDARQLRIQVQGKGRQYRYVPISSGMSTELISFWRTHQNPKWFFPSPGRLWHCAKNLSAILKSTDHHLSASAVQNMFRVARRETAIHPQATVHTLRHCYATHLLEERVSLRLISEYLGHHSLDVTAIYTHITATNEATTRAALNTLHLAVSLSPMESRSSHAAVGATTKATSCKRLVRIPPLAF